MSYNSFAPYIILYLEPLDIRLQIGDIRKRLYQLFLGTISNFIRLFS